jgi:5'-3' exonuclease
MLRVQAPTAFKDVTFNNVKASRSSINDLYAQSITRIEGGVSLEVFETLSAQAEQIRTLTEQNTALLARITALENRPAANTTGLDQRMAALEARVNELVVTE